MKTATINPHLWPVVSDMSEDNFRNGYFGGSNLTANYLNDYSSDGINGFIGEWLDAHLNLPECPDVSALQLLEDPDHLLGECAYEFYRALAWILDDNAEVAEHVEMILVDSGDFFVFEQGETICVVRAEDETAARDTAPEGMPLVGMIVCAGAAS